MQTTRPISMTGPVSILGPFCTLFPVPTEPQVFDTRMMYKQTKSKRRARKCGSSVRAATPLPSLNTRHTFDSLMFRRMPRSYDWTGTKRLLDSHQLKGLYRFLYTPLDFKKHLGYGYSIVVFDSHESAVL